MALQDNFNAIYNRKEQEKHEKEKIKIYNKLIEIELTEALQQKQLDYITENDKNFLYFPKIKKKLIDEVIYSNDTKVLKNSKYIHREQQKAYLYTKYEIITSKSLNIAKKGDELRKKQEAEQIQKQLASEKITEIKTTTKTTTQKQNKNGLPLIFYIIAAPLALLWGILEAIAKKK